MVATRRVTAPRWWHASADTSTPPLDAAERSEPAKRRRGQSPSPSPLPPTGSSRPGNSKMDINFLLGGSGSFPPRWQVEPSLPLHRRWPSPASSMRGWYGEASPAPLAPPLGGAHLAVVKLSAQEARRRWRDREGTLAAKNVCILRPPPLPFIFFIFLPPLFPSPTPWWSSIYLGAGRRIAVGLCQGGGKR